MIECYPKNLVVLVKWTQKRTADYQYTQTYLLQVTTLIKKKVILLLCQFATKQIK